MPPDLKLTEALANHGVPFVIVGGHAVNIHGYVRLTEDTEAVWLRSRESEAALLAALTRIDAKYIGNDIDPATGSDSAGCVLICEGRLDFTG